VHEVLVDRRQLVLELRLHELDHERVALHAESFARVAAFWPKWQRRFTDLYPAANLDSRRLATIVAFDDRTMKERSMTRTVTTAATNPAARRVQTVLIGMLMTLLAVVSLAAWAQTAPPPAGERGWGMHDHAMGMHGHRHGMGGDMGAGIFRGSPEHVGRMIDYMLDGLNATDAQRSQIKQIATAAAADLKAQAESHRALRERAMQAFTAPNVDANAVEQVRQQMLQQHDQMSRRMSLAMIEVARVLTPEQRARVAERMRDRQARMEERMKRMQERMGSTPGTSAPRR
jgi:Spy/CpxP family protein refolding chaperone